MNTMSLVELKALCKERGLSGYSNKNKAALLELLAPTEAGTNLIIDPPLAPAPAPLAPQEAPVPLILHNGDCLVVMKTIADASVDMILVDLPYGMTKNSWDIVIPFDLNGI